MATLPIDLDSLLAPLDAGEQGAGIDLRSDFSPASTYQRLRDARSSARADRTGPRCCWRYRQFDGGRLAGDPDLGQAAFTAQSKDFEVAAWLTEALVRLYGLAGLTAGAGLVTGLCDQYWDIRGFRSPTRRDWRAGVADRRPFRLVGRRHDHAAASAPCSVPPDGRNRSRDLSVGSSGRNGGTERRSTRSAIFRRRARNWRR